ncbi:Fungal lipase-like domain [Sesbania bispinosa]|nr:Fungal lipase-like domain [Sesbania bispinosa]
MANQVVPREAHPFAFHVSGPRNLTTLNWRDLICSSWKNANYKRTVIACFIQAVYLLELDRQENRTKENALAPNWWIPFKYKLTKTLIDERDGSIFGAILEWDRGTLLKSPTMRRDIEDDLRFLAWESLKGSVRFKVALEVLNSICEKYGSSSVCIAGHSLGAGFALQVGKALAKEGIYVEAHLFNPPSVSLSMSLRNIGEKAGEAQVRNDGDKTSSSGLKDASSQVAKWVPHLYVNNSDYICCYYTDHVGTAEKVVDKENRNCKLIQNEATVTAAPTQTPRVGFYTQKVANKGGLSIRPPDGFTGPTASSPTTVRPTGTLEPSYTAGPFHGPTASSAPISAKAHFMVQMHQVVPFLLQGLSGCKFIKPNNYQAQWDFRTNSCCRTIAGRSAGTANRFMQFIPTPGIRSPPQKNDYKLIK